MIIKYIHSNQKPPKKKFPIISMHHRNDKLIKIDPTIMICIDSVHNIVYLFTIHYRVVIFYTNNDRYVL